MVESTKNQDKQKKTGHQYAKFREDKEADAGYSKELICIRTPKEHYNDLDPIPDQGMDTVLKVFRSTAAKQKEL